MGVKEAIFMRFPTLTGKVSSVAVLAAILATGPVVHGQGRTGVGLITAVDTVNATLILDTRTGVQHIRVATAAPIRGDHGGVLTFSDLRPGDAISYEMASETAVRLHVARQFWALP
jgi:hypothetical protein